MAPILDNHYCDHLSNEENMQVFKLLGNRCQSLYTTVVQLYQTQPPLHSQWLQKATGVLCFVKDNIKKNFFFRVFCLRRNFKLWELELYNNLEYIEGAPFFHMFEGEECLVAFNFVSVEDATNFGAIVQQKVRTRNTREEKRTRQISYGRTLQSPVANLQLTSSKTTLGGSTEPTERLRSITKPDIGYPKDFKHISHVGWNSITGFDINTEDEQLREFFKKAGVSQQQLQDKKTRDYIYDFINKNGVREAVVEDATIAVENSNVIPPPVPPKSPRKTSNSGKVPPPVPVKNNGARKPKMELVPSKKVPPAPGNAPPTLPPTRPTQPGDAPERNGVTWRDVAPAPPPLPKGDMNSALNGNPTTPAHSESKEAAPQEDTSSNFLTQIQDGCQLRPVGQRNFKHRASTRSDDLAGVLKRALLKRSTAICPEEEDDDDDKSNDTADWEWEV